MTQDQITAYNFVKACVTEHVVRINKSSKSAGEALSQISDYHLSVILAALNQPQEQPVPDLV